MNESCSSRRCRLELIAPAGDSDCLRAAIENGADAVYFGLQSFNARERATNFTAEELGGVLTTLHRHGVKGYVTLNTLVFPRELDTIEPLLWHIAASGADAIIVQDIGALFLAWPLARLARRNGQQETRERAQPQEARPLHR
ncbi:MAG: hypothetical protein AB1486_02860 [Planctomycetota bacterium]